MNSLYSDVKRYIKQQKDLYPEEIYLEERESTNSMIEEVQDVREKILKCKKCELAEKIKNKVPGRGDFDTKLMLIGEAPGKQEDEQGEPFVGRSGNLLNDILEAIDLDRTEVFISNIIKCRPPNNRNPETNEIENCLPYLKQEIEIVDPKIIVTLGKVASNTILEKDTTLKSLREKKYEYQGRILIPTYHPSALLHNRNLKKPTWQDFKKIKKLVTG